MLLLQDHLYFYLSSVGANLTCPCMVRWTVTATLNIGTYRNSYSVLWVKKYRIFVFGQNFHVVQTLHKMHSIQYCCTHGLLLASSVFEIVWLPSEACCRSIVLDYFVVSCCGIPLFCHMLLFAAFLIIFSKCYLSAVPVSSKPCDQSVDVVCRQENIAFNYLRTLSATTLNIILMMPLRKLVPVLSMKSIPFSTVARSQ